jgi:cyclopropane fatty-acyl-phospholipid synthase-like methyltransferase
MLITTNITRIDTVGVHYSGTLWRWYRNWVGNVEAVTAKYGPRWYRVRRHTFFPLRSSPLL